MPASLDRLLARFRALFRGKELDSELDEELAHHLHALTEDNLKSGMEANEALRQARISLGGALQVREGHREARGIPWLEQWLRDLRYAFRMYKREIGFTSVALLILAVGVGLNTTVFSLVNTVLLRPVPFADSDRLVVITNGPAHAGELSGVTSEVDTWEGLQEMSRSLDRIEGYNPFSVMQTYRLTGTGEPETILSIDVTQGLFGLLGVRPSLGRLFLPEDTVKGAPYRIILTHRLWVRRFGADPNIVGKAVQINGAPTEVVGVLPAADPFASVFFPAIPVDVYSPAQPEVLRGEGNTLTLIGRRRPGFTEKQVEADLPLAIELIKKRYPNRDQYIAAAGQPLHDAIAGSLKKPVLFLWISSAFVLAIVGFNLGGLLLARGAARNREMALRVALGATRSRIMSQLLTECLGLVAAGAMLGAVAALGFIKYLSVRTAVEIPLLEYLRLDGTSLAYTVILCVVTAVVCGAAPAWKFSGGSQTQNPLGEGSRGSTGGPGRSRARNILVILEVALAFALAVSASLMVLSLRNLLKVDLGFRPEHLIAVRVDPVINNGTHTAYIESALDRVRAIPGIEKAGVTDCIPVERDRSWGLYPIIPGRPNELHWVGAHVRIVSPGLVGAMGTPLISGRDFEQSDDRGPPVIIINRTLARTFWPKEEAVGKQIRMPVGPNNGSNCTVIGVVADVRSSGPELGSGNEFYLTLGQYPYASSWDLMVRTSLPVNSLAASLKDSLRSMDSTLPFTKIREMQTLVDRTLSSRRLLVNLIGGFAAIAIGLALVGLYGVISYMVSQQTREIGIRIALGAGASHVQRQIVGKTLTLAFSGLGLGLCGTLIGGGLMTSLLYGISPNDPMTYVAAVAALLACAVVAGYIPAWRASRIDPAIALRAE
ncbi:MAG TPA: ABC transporter permease [Opitutaceae bacterium]